jgi:isopenicillin-N epimerase
MNPFGRRLRRRFLLEPGVAFLNHGSFGAAPRAVLAAADRWRRRMEANPDRFLREELPGALRAAAGRLARFVHAEERDLAFVENATAGMNAVLRSLDFRRGDEILATTHVYNAVKQTIREVCRRSGAKLVEAKIVLPVEDAEDLFSAVSLGADWYAGNCHKWLFAPKGCAFLWARRGAQDGIHPPVISHGYGKGYAAEFDWTGTRDFSAWLAVPAGIDFYRKKGSARIRRYNHRLATAAAEKLAAAWNCITDGPAELHGAMMSVRLPKRLQRRDPGHLMSGFLARQSTVVAVMAIDGTLWARVSAQIYNAAGDYDRLRLAVTRYS